MARHKPAPKPVDADDCCGGLVTHKASCENASSGLPAPPMGSILYRDAQTSELRVRDEEGDRPLTSLAERLEQAKAKLEAAETVAMSCYWQGAVDALEAYSRGIAHETTAIGAGVKES